MSHCIRTSAKQLQQCWFLTGPTASGKTETALLLAERLDAEIVAMDSMSLYRGMDIGTAKPAAPEQARVPHHLIDVAWPDEDYSLAQYVHAASDAVADILKRGRTPLFVGGTGLYLRGLLRGVFQGPPADWELRRTLEAQAEEHGPHWLAEQLRQVDPVTAAKLHPNDRRRIVRALEVFRLTGQPLSALQTQEPLPPEQRPRGVFWLEVPRDWLYQRINDRVDSMIQRGLVDEVQRLLSSSHPPARTARQALGYAEIIGYLEDRYSLAEAIDTIKTRSRQFAKRQHTWFRNLAECRPLPVTIPTDPADIAAALLAAASHQD